MTNRFSGAIVILTATILTTGALTGCVAGESASAACTSIKKLEAATEAQTPDKDELITVSGKLEESAGDDKVLLEVVRTVQYFAYTPPESPTPHEYNQRRLAALATIDIAAKAEHCA